MRKHKARISLFVFLTCFSVQVFSTQSHTIKKYRVQIEPDFKNKSIRGSTELVIHGLVAQEVSFLLQGLEIDSVTVKKKIIPYSKKNGKLVIDFSKVKKENTILIKYHGQPTKGLVWGNNYVYTNYDPCTWMICIDDPGLRLPVEIRVETQSHFKIVTTTDQRGYASYLYGFAAGDFKRVLKKIGILNSNIWGLNNQLKI